MTKSLHKHMLIPLVCIFISESIALQSKFVYSVSVSIPLPQQLQQNSTIVELRTPFGNVIPYSFSVNKKKYRYLHSRTQVKERFVAHWWFEEKDSILTIQLLHGQPGNLLIDFHSAGDQMIEKEHLRALQPKGKSASGLNVVFLKRIE